jgi:cell division protease FtsH
MKPNKNTDMDNGLNEVNPYQEDHGIPPGRGGGPPVGKSPKKFNPFHIIIVIFLINFLLNFLFSSMSGSGLQIEYSQYIKLVESGNVSRVQIDDEALQITLTKDANLTEVENILYPNGRNNQQSSPQSDDVFTTVRIDDSALVERLNENNVDFYKPQTRSSPILSFLFSWIVPVLLMYLLFSFMSRRVMRSMGQGGGMGGMFGIGKSKAKEYKHEKSTGVRFDDVAGQDEAKESLVELVDLLKHPEKYQEIGAKQPKGALLVGPPGTGKTLLAKAIAGEAGVPFYSISGSEFVEMFVGVGASRVRDLFENAKKNAPCIIFIDEIDAIGKSRDNQLGSNDEREQTLNQLLSEMDGFDGKKGIIVLAATNRPEILDKALLRPGRFDRRIIVEKPDLPGREAILKVHAAKVKLAEDVNLYEIALATSGATGADLANMINEGALLTVRDDRKLVSQKDLMEAVEVVIAGKEKKDRVMNPQERRMVAYHEVGHAVISARQKNSQPVQKITIVPRTMGSLGYTMNMPEEERYLLTKNELLAQITTLLGGRAAEIVQFGEVTTGATNDIERATALARGMVTQYGMSEKFGPMGLESVQSRYLDGKSVRNCSEATETLVDEEVRQILSACQKTATEILSQNRDTLDNIAEYLLEKENITGDEFMRLLDAPAS